MRGRTRLHVLVWVDAAALLSLAALAATGFVIRYVLPPGTGGGWRVGAGHAADGEVKALLGYTRHQWGYLHYIVALVFLGLMLVHVLLHWNWIKCYFARNTRAPACASEGDGDDGKPS